MRTSPNAAAGQEAGYVARYRVIGYKGRSYAAHRLAWYFIYGVWPELPIDHINGDRLDNRIENLRECALGSNSQNSKLNKNNTSGFGGVHWNPRLSKWCARIMINKVNYNLGHFTRPEEAREAYVEAKVRSHPLYEGRDV